jgi:hypothetical protein
MAELVTKRVAAQHRPRHTRVNAWVRRPALLPKQTRLGHGRKRSMPGLVVPAGSSAAPLRPPSYPQRRGYAGVQPDDGKFAKVIRRPCGGACPAPRAPLVKPRDRRSVKARPRGVSLGSAAPGRARPLALSPVARGLVTVACGHASALLEAPPLPPACGGAFHLVAPSSWKWHSGGPTR